MKGRPPKPSNVVALTGNAGKRKRHVSKPPMKGDAPTPPPDMNADALAVWEDIVPQLVTSGVIARTDKAQVAAYCNIEARRRQAQRVLDDLKTLTYETHGRNGPMFRARPEVAIVTQCETQLKSFAAEWGLTALARKRLDQQDQGNLFDDPTADAF